jgi:uncharacterized protein (TIGR02246 family)
MVDRPADIAPTFERLFNSGDAEGLMKLYAPDAIFIHPDGRVLRSAAEIRETLNAFLTGRPRITIKNEYCQVTGDTALLRSRWTLAGKDEKGQPTEAGGIASEVMRRQPSGKWLYIIDAPVGGA